MNTDRIPSFAAIVIAITILEIIAFTAIGVTTSVIINIDLDKVLRADAGWWPAVIVVVLLFVFIFYNKIKYLIKHATSFTSSSRRHTHKPACKG